MNYTETNNRKKRRRKEKIKRAEEFQKAERMGLGQAVNELRSDWFDHRVLLRVASTGIQSMVGYKD